MADKALADVRSEFVDNVSKEVISQLLDDLLRDGVLNDGERESVLEENLNRGDKARQLIDTVKRKGHGASSLMIAHLEKRDPTLHSKLSFGQFQSDNVKQNWVTSPIATTKAFWRMKQDDTNTYPSAMKSIQSRVALLITNIKFKDENLNRDGAEKDEENMERLLKALGYEVVKFTNLTGEEINNAIIAFSKHPKLQETDSVWVVIMSHGKLGTVLGVDYKRGDKRPDEFPINNIYDNLGSSKCPALLNKPKIIIIQACRGEEGGAVLVTDSGNPEVCEDMEVSDLEEDALKCVHKEKDFLSLLSCTPETVSYRRRGHGSFLIQFVVEVFSTFAHQDDIEELCRKVLRRFEDFDIVNRRQMPTKDRCTLTKRFYLFPGLI